MSETPYRRPGREKAHMDDERGEGPQQVCYGALLAWSSHLSIAWSIETSKSVPPRAAPADDIASPEARCDAPAASGGQVNQGQDRDQPQDRPVVATRGRRRYHRREILESKDGGYGRRLHFGRARCRYVRTGTGAAPRWDAWLSENGVSPGECVALHVRTDARSGAALLALLSREQSVLLWRRPIPSRAVK